MKGKRVVFLINNMLDDNGTVVFQADIPYTVTGNLIINEDNFAVHIADIWVDYHLVHKSIREESPIY